MAIEKEVNVIISASDKFSAVTDLFLDKAGLIGGVVTAMIGAFTAAGVAATAFAVKIGKEVVAEAGDFQNAVFQVGAVAQASGTSMEDISAILDDLTNKFPVTGAQAGAAMETIAQLGFGAKDSLEGLSKASLNLSVATGRDMNTAALLLTATMNQFNLGVEDSERLVNLFSAAQFNSAAAVEDLQTAMQFMGPTFSQTGQTIEEATAAIAVLRNQGIDASIAGTQLRMAMLKLIEPTKDGKAALEGMGLSLAEVNPETHAFSDIVGVLAAKNLTLADAVKIFGVRAGPLVSILANNVDQLKAMNATITGTNAGIDAVNTKMQSWSVVTANLDGTMSLFKKTIGEDLLKAVIDLIGVTEKDGIRAIITKFQEMEKESNRIGGPLVELFENIKDAIEKAFGEEIGSVEDFYNLIGDTMETIASMSEIFLQFGIAGGKVLLGFIESTNSWMKNTDAVVFSVKTLNTVLGAMALPVAAIIDGIQLMIFGWQSIGTAIEASVNWVQEKFYGALESILILMDKLPFIDLGDEIASLREITESFADANMKLWGEFPEGPKLLTDNVAAAIVTVDEFADSLGTTSEAMKQVKDSGTEATGAVALYKGSTEDIIAKLDEMDAAQEAASGSTENLGEQFKIVAGQVFDTVTQAEDYAAALANTEKATGQWLEVLDEQGNVLSRVWEAYTEVGDSADVASEKAKGIGVEVDDLQRKLDQEMQIKIMDAEAKLKIETMKTEADKLVSLLEIQAKVDIAEIEAAAKTAEAMWGSIADQSKIVETSISKIKDIADINPTAAWNIAKSAADIAKAQAELTKSQKEYIDAQTQAIDAQRKALESGEGRLINVTVEGDMEGWLRGLLQSLMEEMFIKAQAENFLCLCQS